MIKILISIFCLFVCFIELPIKADNVLFPEQENNDDIYEALNNLEQTLVIIKHSYVNDIKISSLINKATHDVLSHLDEHSAYITANELHKINQYVDGEIDGIGIEIYSNDLGEIRVLSVISNSPAYNAGIKFNDNIIKINDINVAHMSIGDVAMLIKASMKVNLSVKRSSGDLMDVNLMMTHFFLPSLKWLVYDNVLYIKLYSFANNTSDELKGALNRAISDINPRGIILDLRDNPGGLLDQAIDVAGYFIGKKNIVYTKNKMNNKRYYKSSVNSIGDDLPMLTIINNRSASASEIVAAALQEYGRSKIIGERSMGKGSVQSTIILHNGDAIKLTTDLYYTPNHYLVENRGVIPDILISCKDDLTKDASEFSPDTLMLDSIFLSSLRLIRQMIDE